MKPARFIFICAILSGHFIFGMTCLPDPQFTKYPDFAKLLYEGRLAGEEIASISPLYLFLNILFTPDVLRVIQGLAGTLLLGCIYAIARKAFDEKTAIIAVLLASFSRLLLVYEVVLEPDLLLSVFGCLSVALLYCGKRTSVMSIFSGITMGIALSLRPSLFILLVFLSLWLLAVNWKKTGGKYSFRQSGFFLLFALLAACAVLMSVKTFFGSRLSATMSPGQVFYEGNRPETVGIHSNPPRLLKHMEFQKISSPVPDMAHNIYRVFARADRGNSLDAFQIQKYWVGKSLAFFYYEPLSYLGGWTRKFVFILTGSTSHEIESIYETLQYLDKFPLINIRLVCLLSVSGFLIMLAKKRVSWLLILYWLGPAIGMVLFFVSERHALILLPIRCIFAAYVISQSIYAFKNREKILQAVLCLTLPLCLLKIPYVQSEERYTERKLFSNYAFKVYHPLYKRGALSEALKVYVDAQSAYPYLKLYYNISNLPFESPHTWEAMASRSEHLWGEENGIDAYFLALQYFHAGDFDSALEMAKKASGKDFFYSFFNETFDPDLLSARCLIMKKKQPEAYAYILTSLEKRPATLEGLSEAIAGAHVAGNVSKQRMQLWESEIRAIHDPLSASYALGKSFHRWGQPQKALKEFDRILRHFEGVAVVEYEKALVLADSGADKDALSTLMKAMTHYPNFNFPLLPFQKVINAQWKNDPENQALWHLMVQVSIRNGQYAEARENAEKALNAFGANTSQGLKYLNSILQDFHKDKE